MTLQTLINAINETSDLSQRCDDFLYASARQTDKGNTVNGNALLVEALNLLRDNTDIRNDYFISQVAFEFTRLQQMNRAGNAVNYISDPDIYNATLARMATERAKTSLQDANNIVQAITDSTIKDQTISSVAIIVAQSGDLTTARNIVNSINDNELRVTMDRTCIRESSKGL